MLVLAYRGMGQTTAEKKPKELGTAEMGPLALPGEMGWDSAPRLAAKSSRVSAGNYEVTRVGSGTPMPHAGSWGQQGDNRSHQGTRSLPRYGATRIS